jgi:hypothetical protein
MHKGRAWIHSTLKEFAVCSKILRPRPKTWCINSCTVWPSLLFAGKSFKVASIDININYLKFELMGTSDDRLIKWRSLSPKLDHPLEERGGLAQQHIHIDGNVCWNTNHRLPFIVYRPRKTNFRFLFLLAENERKFAVSVFCLQQTNGKCCFR